MIRLTVPMTLPAHHIVTRAKSGSKHNGDRAAVFEDGNGSLIVVVDALGTGEGAAATARLALQAAEALASRDVDQVLTGMHVALRGSTGAAAMAVRIDDGTLTVAGVGNVSFRATSGMSILVTTSPGILGFQHASLDVQRVAVRTGARVALFTDGVAPSLDPSELCDLDVPAAAAELFRRNAVAFDDATLVLLEL